MVWKVFTKLNWRNQLNLVGPQFGTEKQAATKFI